MNRINAIKFMHCPKLIKATCLILCIFLALSSSFNVIGQTIYDPHQVFTVAKIYVDVTAKTASAARRKALAKGEREAFYVLLKRLTLRIDHDRLPVLDAKQISAYVQDFGVTNEKNSRIRYLADLTYRFKPNDVRLLLRDSEVQFAETISKPILVLPVYQLAGAAFLWDNPNPWREAWVGHPKTIKTRIQRRVVGLVPMVFGNGDLTDIATISAELAVKGDIQSLLAIAKKYQAAASLVVLANLRSTPQGLTVLKVRVSKYDRHTSRHVFSMLIKAKKMESVGVLLHRSAKEVATRIEELWKVDNLLMFENIGVITVTLPINSLAEWVDVRRRLAKVAVVESAELVIFSRKEVRLNIHFIGEHDQLKLALAQLDMNLKEEEGSWILRAQKRNRSDAGKSLKGK